MLKEAEKLAGETKREVFLEQTLSGALNYGEDLERQLGTEGGTAVTARL